MAGKAEAPILRRSEAQKILRAMIEGRLAVAEPTVDFEGGVRYIKVEELAEASSKLV